MLISHEKSNECRYIKYLNEIPPIPEELLEPIDVILEKPPMTKGRYVQNKEVSKELFDWLIQQFARPIVVWYQVIVGTIFILST